MLEFVEEHYQVLVKLEKLLLEDEGLDRMLKNATESDTYLLIALEAALPILKGKLDNQNKEKS